MSLPTMRTTIGAHCTGSLFYTSPRPPRTCHVGAGNLLAKRLSAAVANRLIHHPDKRPVCNNKGIDFRRNRYDAIKADR